MDLESIVNEFGLEDVDRMFQLCNTFNVSNPSLIDVLLGLINDHFLKFRERESDLKFDKKEIKVFLSCANYLRQIILSARTRQVDG
ncbi:p10 [Strawberry pallidosis-associated virus]|uniref:p10 n=1 Tax=Strawberry pallidosis-associated virus TaxID=227507 RepID=Q6JGV8_9CLOS|nr:p10 [Strawberry pallidosis-associated virus]AAS79679.1 p10 [Strawberry pallidosis-associated virus]QNN88891.1 p9 [Strawberry pallidosis-associated virus]QZN83693.1 p10 [Strawberry pallidosis-associated virus]UDP24128.1 p10 [Strawberry pallidosis-associated virus]UDP24136.1 p10 [Strawberry pallidosis-associated virus]